MDVSPLKIHKVAVLGAGVMGAQIAAHFANVGIKPILFDLPSSEEDQNSLVKQSITGLAKLSPAPLVIADLEDQITPANYKSDLALLYECDLVIEAISERLDWKEDLYQQIIPYLQKDNVVLATNTSGLSISALAKNLPKNIQKRFLGIHFFNPPRYMRLIELIPHEKTDKSLLKCLEAFLVTYLGKGVIYAKDTPNFIGNRIGMFSLLAALYHSERLGILPDMVDSLTGGLIGHPKSATFRTLDIVGLDTFKQVINTMKADLPDDPWNKFFKVPDWIINLIEKGALGAKVNMGVYKKTDQEVKVIDLKLGTYRNIQHKVNPKIIKILEIPSVNERFNQLRSSDLVEAKFLWRYFCELFHYCYYHVHDLAYSIKDVDLVMRWGYGWSYGPFELWQEAGWNNIKTWLLATISAKDTMNSELLSNWISGPQNRSDTYNSVYKRQYFPDTVFGDPEELGFTIAETENARLWTLDNQIAIASLKSKYNTFGFEVVNDLSAFIKLAESKYQALILWPKEGKDFSYGLNLKEIVAAVELSDFSALANGIKNFQRLAIQLRNACIPTIAAVRGLVMGGACGLLMHCDKTVAALESYIGLIETGIGIIPIAGSKEMAYRAALFAGGNIVQSIHKMYMTVARGILTQSALEARQKKFLCSGDIIVPNVNEVLYVAHQHAKALSESSYMPPLFSKFKVAGREGKVAINSQLTNLREEQIISDHDYLISCELAHVMCGGDVAAGTEVDEDWMLKLELDSLIKLLRTEKTQDKLKHMLTYGKFLKN